MELRGKVVFITGASRGIGKALSDAMAASECRLLLTALEGDELASHTQYLKDKYGVDVDSMPANLVNHDDRRKLLAWIKTRDSALDVLVNNAGASSFGRFSAWRPSDIERIIELGISTPVEFVLELLPILKTRPVAKIVNISSAISRLPYPGLAVYGAAKGFLSSFSESLACELTGTNVSVLCFHPGFTDTQFMTSAGMDMSRIPNALLHTPEATAASIIRALKKDKVWAYSDAATRVSVGLARILPERVKTRLFSNLFWRLPHE